MSEALPALIQTQLFRFLTVGAGAALLFFVLSWLLMSLGASPFIGSVVAYAVAFVLAYSAQRGWTFGGRHDHARVMPRYLALQLGCAVLSGLVSHVAVARFGMSAFAMSALTTVAASAVSYILSSLWVFAPRE
ncbi:GtrA family protein [Mesorhizobium sp. B2-3-10]|uniref:GtrA family protein n=1 Tax=Mesorhizobium sp. B2-3-10 TaxID=2589954 RepID=UPI001125BD5D|nr:GtrA family protein [Mesorhizobium sp. B2-3-10]TPM04120.1 GtrA family protein [Mesorhizobium sp. B2-3-10]